MIEFQFLGLVRQTTVKGDLGWSVPRRGENKWGILQVLTSLVWILFFSVGLIKMRYIGFLRVLCSNCHLATLEGAGVPWGSCWIQEVQWSERNTHTLNWLHCFVEGYAWRCSRHFCTKSTFSFLNNQPLTVGCILLFMWLCDATLRCSTFQAVNLCGATCETVF